MAEVFELAVVDRRGQKPMTMALAKAIGEGRRRRQRAVGVGESQ